MRKKRAGPQEANSPQYSNFGKNAMQRIVDVFHNKMTETMKAEMQNLMKDRSKKEKEVRAINNKLEELEGENAFLKAETNQEVQVLQGKLYEKAKVQIEQLKNLQSQSESTINELTQRLAVLDSENVLIKESIEEELDRLIDEIQREKTIAGSYKQREAELMAQLEYQNKEILREKRHIEELIAVLGGKDSELKQGQVLLNESLARNKQLTNALGQRDTEIEKIIKENSRLKQVIEKVHFDPNQDVKRDGVQREEMANRVSEEERDKYEWQILELKKQVQTLSMESKGKASQGNFSNELIDMINSPNGERSQSTTSSNKSTQCIILETIFKESIEIILHETKIISPDHDLSLGELQNIIWKTIKGLKERLEEERQENESLRTIGENYNKVANKLQKKESKFKEVEEVLARQLQDKQAEIDKLKEVVVDQRREILSLSNRPSERSSTKSNGLAWNKKKMIANSFSCQTNTISVSHSSAVLQTETKISADFSCQCNDEEGLSRLQTVEKKYKEAKSEVSQKNKLIKEMEALNVQLEEELSGAKLELQERADREAVIEGLEKKVAIGAQDLQAKDKKNIELFAHIKSLKADNENLEGQVKGLQEQISGLKQKNKQGMFAQRKVALGNQRDSIQSLETASSELKKELEETREEALSLYKKVLCKSSVGRQVLS
jgi:hypothetical protein